MGTFILTQKAKDDLLGIGRYTQAMGQGPAETLCDPEFDSAFHDLADKPGLGRACDDVREGYFKYKLIGPLQVQPQLRAMPKNRPNP
jgi:toxin ParE1/3/4